MSIKSSHTDDESEAVFLPNKNEKEMNSSKLKDKQIDSKIMISINIYLLCRSSVAIIYWMEWHQKESG